VGAEVIEIGPGRFAHASGALWLPGARALVAADVHLGYAWAMRRRRQLGPLAEGGISPKLAGAVGDLKPGVVVLLGDVVHAAAPSEEERAVVQRTLDRIRANTRLIVVRGNHDRKFARDYGLDMVDQWECGDVLALHGHRVPDANGRHLVIGHVHPALSVVDDAGASRRVPVFLASSRVTALPAFSPFATGIDVRHRLPSPLDTLVGGADVQVYAVSGRRVVALGPLSRL
jgi:putative SbcD/Mre11-related phosphoesterase